MFQPSPFFPLLVPAPRVALSTAPPRASQWIKRRNGSPPEPCATPGGDRRHPGLCGKQLGLLKEIIPTLSRVAVFGVPGLNATEFKAAETAARTLNIEAEIMEVNIVDDFEGAIETAKARHVEAGILLSSPLVFVYSRQIAELALAKRFPLISLFGQFPQNGGLVAYGPNLPEMFGRCGSFVGKILQGAKPSDLPIQRPQKFDLAINLKTAATLGVTAPPLLVTTADDVIE